MIGTIERIKKYDMMSSFYSKKNIEPYLSVITTSMFLIVFVVIDYHGNFNAFLDISNNIFLCIIAGLFGIIGFALSGIAIIVSLFTKQDTETIDKYNAKGTLGKVMSGYEFLAFHCAFNIVGMFILYIFSNSMLEILPVVVFYIVVGIVVYFVSFDIFYMCSLVGNCVKLHEIKCSYERVKELERSVLDNANEIRVDLLLSIIMNHTGITLEELTDTLNDYIDASSYSNKESVRDYINAVYDKEK